MKGASGVNKTRNYRMVGVGLVVLAMQLPAPGSDTYASEPVAEAVPEPMSLEDFEILEYVATSKYPPSALIAMDNNARILLACREGRSPAKLRESGIEASDSQIEFLIVMNLLFRDGVGDLYTTFPILDSVEMTALREETTKLAQDLGETVRSDVEALAAALDAAGYGEHGYPILFSYVLDGMVWGFLEEYEKVPPRRLSARRPFWSGEVWAVRPARESRAETRTIASEGLKITITSSSNTEGGADFFADREVLKAAISKTSTSFLVEEPQTREQLRHWSFLDDAGQWTIPVIDEVKKDTVFRAAEALTSNLVDAMLEGDVFAGFEARYGFRYPSQALVIGYHELMWDLIDRFEELGLVSRPEGLAGEPGDAVTSGRGSAFLVDRRYPKPNRQDEVTPVRDTVEEMPVGGDG